MKDGTISQQLISCGAKGFLLMCWFGTTMAILILVQKSSEPNLKPCYFGCALQVSDKIVTLRGCFFSEDLRNVSEWTGAICCFNEATMCMYTYRWFEALTIQHADSVFICRHVDFVQHFHQTLSRHSISLSPYIYTGAVFPTSFSTKLGFLAVSWYGSITTWKKPTTLSVFKCVQQGYSAGRFQEETTSNVRRSKWVSILQHAYCNRALVGRVQETATLYRGCGAMHHQSNAAKLNFPHPPLYWRGTHGALPCQGHILKARNFLENRRISSWTTLSEKHLLTTPRVNSTPNVVH